MTLHWNSDNHLFSHPTVANDAANLVLAGTNILNDISLNVPHHTPSISNQKSIMGHIVSKRAMELSYIKRLSYMKDVTTENNSNFELGVRDVVDIPI